MNKKTKWGKKIVITFYSGAFLILMAVFAVTTRFYQPFRFPEESKKELLQNLSKLSSDEEMIKTYYSHTEQFQKLVDELLAAKADVGICRITRHFTWPPGFDDLMKNQVTQYRELMSELGLSEVNADNDKMVLLEADYYPRFVKSYAFATADAAQFQAVDSLNSYKPDDKTFREGYTVFRHIDGNWYLHLQCYAYDPYPM